MGRGGPVALLVVLASLATARADYEETERRLKFAGVEPAMRERIHMAIDRGVGFLLARQDAGGSWPVREAGSYQVYLQTGIAALCTLALRHAGTAPAKSGFDKGIAFLFPALGSGGRKEIHEDVYTAGITNMILMADRSRPEVARRLTHEIARGCDAATGWWGYLLPPEYPTDVAPGRGRDKINFSTTQFAALGLWAGERLAACGDRKLWRRHLESLVGAQLENGAWPYFPPAEFPRFKKEGAVAGDAVRISDGRGLARVDRGYPTLTFMGLANLLLAERALGEELKQDPVLAVRTKAARWRAIDALDRDVPKLFAHLREQGWIDLDTFYALYALEKACIFSGRSEVGGVPWYLAGARWLCDTQRADGGWNDVEGGFATGPDIDTAFALLFLLRASEAYTPSDPRPVDSVTNTPGDELPAVTQPAPLLDAPLAPTRIPVEAAIARSFLDELRLRLEDRSATNDDLVASLRKVEMAYGAIVPDEGTNRDAAFAAQAVAWKREAHRLALAAVVCERVDLRLHQNVRLPVNLAAAAMLGGWDSDVSVGLVHAFERSIFHANGYAVDPTLYETGFATLAALNRAESFEWLARTVVDTGTSADALARTRHALTALIAFDAVPGATRLAAVTRLVQRFAPLAESDLPHAKRLMDEVGGPLVTALRHLSRDPRNGRAPSIGSDEVRTLPDFLRWRAAHLDGDLPPWR